MITDITLRNFQSHKETTLNFDPGVNVIVGQSDSGKSAIFRALRWVVYNRPQGESFRSRWGGETEVEVGMMDPEWIVLRKKGKIEEYVLATPGRQDVVFHAFKTEVPKEIQEALNLADINIQNQLDSPFLLSSSPGEVATHFNKVARLDQIDSGTQKVNGWIRELTTTIGSEAIKDKPATGLIKQIADINLQLADFECLDTLEIEVEVIEQQSAQLKGLRVREHGLTLLKNEIISSQEELDEASEILKIEAPLVVILNAYKERKEKLLESSSLSLFIGLIKEDQEQIEEQNLYLEIAPLLNTILALYEARQKKKEEYQSLYKSALEAIQNKRLLEAAEETYEQLHLQFEANFPLTCPLCGNDTEKHNY